jgi:nitrate reductase (NAD(P)H)
MAASVERHLAPHPWPSNAPPKTSFDMFSPGNKRRSGSDSDSDDDDNIPPDWRSLYHPRLEVEPPVHDPRDEATSDAWVRRHPALVRLTGKHPFNSEPPVPRLMAHGFITPVPLHYVRNHGAVPKADWSTWTVEVTGLVRRPARLTMEQLATEFEAVELPVTLVCAGNRRKEQNMVRQTVGFNWGPGAISTSVWRGVRLRDVLRRCGVMGAAAGAANVCFEGAEDLPGGGGCKYGTSLRREVAMDPARDVILAYMQNGEPLAPDHGFPVRVIVPGFIGGRMVKWLKRIIVASSESESYYHYRDNRVLPSHVDAELANAEGIFRAAAECAISFSSGRPAFSPHVLDVQRGGTNRST